MAPCSNNNSDLEKTLQALPRFQPSTGFAFKLGCRLAYSQRAAVLHEGLFLLGRTFKAASLVTTTAVLLFASLSSYAFMSSSVNPNTPFFGSFERFADGIYVAMAGSQDERTEIQLDLAKKRLEELAAAAQNGTLTEDMINEVTNTSSTLLASAKDVSSAHLKVEALKSLAEASGQTLNTLTSAKGKAVNALAGDENLSPEVLQEIAYRVMGINLSSEQLVAANQSPSLETDPNTSVTAKDLYIIHNDPRERETAAPQAPSLQAGTVLQALSLKPEIAVLDQALNEVQKQTDLSSLAASVDLPVNEDAVTLE